MYYTIYKITNKTNNKYYIGKHQTKNLDDGYMGSGKLLKRAIAKYGIENFNKEILFIFESEEEMNYKEKELVIISEETYNLCPGGNGGFGYINSNNLTPRRFLSSEEAKSMNKKIKNRKGGETQNSRNARKLKYPNGTFFGKKHSVETKQKMSKTISLKCLGQKNSQYGTIWITNGVENKKIKNTEKIPTGFWKGRIIAGFV